MGDPFVGIAGNPAAKEVLAHEVNAGRLSHAYLFTGDAMLGKTTVAQALARALLPQAPLSRHPDYWEDDRAEALKIDEIRLLPERQPEHHAQSLQAFLAMKPALGEHRVAVISNVGRLADPVQGILLKTLEEPHAGRVIVLTTPGLSPFVVLPTVVSRCQRVSFHAASEGEIAALLTRVGTDPEQARTLAQLSRGRPGWALRAVQDPDIVERYEGWARRLDEIVGAPQDVALRLAAELEQAGSQARRSRRQDSPRQDGRSDWVEDPLELALTSWQLHLRRRMEEATRPAEQARWARLLEATFDTLGYLEQNVSPRLALECFLLEASRAA
ncbi:MAG: ATP-binding protein [Candidatus Dormibacteraceae bacterium]